MATAIDGRGAVRLSYSVGTQNDIWAERFIKTLLHEWAYVRPYRSNAARMAALPRWVAFYNQRRPHTALRGLTPQAAVNNVTEHHT